jgi:hypothetical protein
MKTILGARKSWRKRTGFALVASAIISLTGCGDGRPTRVPVSGRVLIDGQPLDSGNIRVHPAANRPASAKIEADGRFTLSTYEFGDGCVLGEHPVTVTSMKMLNANTVRWLAPKKYAGGDTTDLRIDVSEATDSAEINLTWAGGKPFEERLVGGGD